MPVIIVDTNQVTDVIRYNKATSKGTTEQTRSNEELFAREALDTAAEPGLNRIGHTYGNQASQQDRVMEKDNIDIHRHSKGRLNSEEVRPPANDIERTKVTEMVYTDGEEKKPPENTPQETHILSKAGSSLAPDTGSVAAKPVVVEDNSNESEQHLLWEKDAKHLPDFVWIPFEKAVEGETLRGWEDDWVASAKFDRDKRGIQQEPKIDFVYLWVNGSEADFQTTIRPWEERSILNDPEVKWVRSHGTNRYRDWDELRYSFRSNEKNAGHFINTVKILVNSIYENGRAVRKQTPEWLATEQQQTKRPVQVVAQKELFERATVARLPTFNSLTIENQIFNTASDLDQFFTLSDDMLLTRNHSAADIYSPLFGASLSFKTNGYSKTTPPTDIDSQRFGEKPYLIYTSWLLNRRFGVRKRKGQSHFGHSLSRSIMRQAVEGFPRPERQSVCKRFRGELGFQLYSWYATYHCLIERHREALIWNYVMLRSDVDRDGVLSWEERQTVIAELAAGAENSERSTFRQKLFYRVPSKLARAGLRPPQVNPNILWTSLDGPWAIKDAECTSFSLDECLAPGFDSITGQPSTLTPTFSSALIFDRLARQNSNCGDCLLKRILHQTPSGLGPLLPRAETQQSDRELVLKVLMRYKYVIVDPSDALFVMVTDADQIDSTLSRNYLRESKQLSGQMRLNDDVETTDEQELKDVQNAMRELLHGLFPDPSGAETTL
ncbi:hypothetical protein PV08_09737 [Exophiala spinifera]|uniref:Uncharacterized protein n=1 Tax=Exophiala spinifera TaxID=91928 RepID=A0A0D2B1D6_9EURO|nr:uncharacterized protein PV08_09737 [Exophiala spinifera]KIW12460.1 hypothetical protein PV08_09737 [Exophiala spinifera]